MMGLIRVVSKSGASRVAIRSFAAAAGPAGGAAAAAPTDMTHGGLKVIKGFKGMM